MNGRNLKEGQWEDREQWSLGVGQRRKTFQNRRWMNKGGRWVRLTTLPPYCAVVKKSGNLNFLEPSGPLQACNGTALPYFRKYCAKIEVVWIIARLYFDIR
jgi:hypothetical protein